ncbi:MAG: septum site-determining protein MinC [Desulfobacterales bacterium]
MTSAHQLRPPVRLKGVGDSLWVTLDASLSVETIQIELKKIFDRLNHSAINTRIVLDPGDAGDHEDLISRLGAFLKDRYHVRSVSLPPPKKSPRTAKIRHRDMTDSWRYRRSDALFMRGRVRSGQTVEAGRHFILMGDVNPGGQILAGGDIVILGSLRGTAKAGYPENQDAVILALDFRPTQVQIGEIVAAGQSVAAEKTTEYAYVNNGVIVVEDYLESDPFGKIPWPEIR